MQLELDHASAIVRALMHSPPAGPYASEYRVLKVENNVGGANLGMKLPVDVQLRVLPITQKNFTGNIARLSIGNPGGDMAHATALVFRPGSVEIVGARSPDMMRLMLHALAARLAAFGYAPRVQYLSSDNKVAAGNFGFCLDLAAMNNNLPGFYTMYKPSVFPGLVCSTQVRRPRMSFMLFENGKVMALGIEDIRLANEVYLKVLAVAQEFRIDAAVLRQRRKSAEREVRKLNEQQAGSGRGRYQRAKKILRALDEYFDANRERMNDTNFSVNMKHDLERLLTVDAATAVRRKRIVASGGGSAPASAKRAMSTPDPTPDEKRQRTFVTVGEETTTLATGYVAMATTAASGSDTEEMATVDTTDCDDTTGGGDDDTDAAYSYSDAELDDVYMFE